jgi:hypothetical protein
MVRNDGCDSTVTQNDDIYKSATSEEEVPPICDNPSNCLRVRQLTASQINAVTKREKTKWECDTKGKLSTVAFILLISVLIVILGLYIFDTIIDNKNLKNSSMLSSVFDYLKVVASTLMGYLFANSLGSSK